MPERLEKSTTRPEAAVFRRRFAWSFRRAIA
jgi:hypothetical protein